MIPYIEALSVACGDSSPGVGAIGRPGKSEQTARGFLKT